MAVLCGVAGATGRVARPGSRTHLHLFGLNGRTRRFDYSMGARGPPAAGGPKERGGAPARSLHCN